jgi:hypothetical protein
LIYLDSSVALAQLLGEGRVPAESFWDGLLISSRLLEYEIWNRIHARGFGESLDGATRALVGRVVFIELDRLVLARALRPFSVPVRTLDSVHLASIEFLRSGGEEIELASYDNRLVAAAQVLGIPLAAL